MALRFCDSFSHYATAQLAAKYNFVWAATINATGSPYGTGALSNDDGSIVRKDFDNQASWYVGFRRYYNGFANGAKDELVLYDSGTIQLSLRTDTNGRVLLYRNGTQIAASANGVIRQAAWQYLELGATINAAGTAVVRVDGNTVINFSGNTQASANAWANQVAWAGQQYGGSLYCDGYICDGTGAKNNTFLGDVRVQAVLPTGAGTYTEWDGLTGAASHWQAQSDSPPNGDTSYVSDTLGTPGHRDTYAMGDVSPTAGTVPGVQVCAYARKDDAGARTLATMVRGGGVAADSVGAAVSLIATYEYVAQVYENDPTGAAWTIATVNGAEAGIKAVA